MSTLKVDTIATRSGSGNITASNNIAGNLVGNVTGNVTGSGNSTIGGTLGVTGLITASAGVAIGGTGAANTLDDYEEGTWVPVVKATSGGSAYTYSNDYEFRLPGLTSSTNALPYTKIGNKVFITFSIWWNSAATTRYNINLPFACKTPFILASATPLFMLFLITIILLIASNVFGV